MMSLKEIDPYKVIDFTEWQNILDILSKISGAKSAAITKIDLPYIQVLKLTASPDLPFYEGMSIELVNRYCENVFHSQESVLVTNALKQEQWKNAPEIKHGLISYLGFPLFLPNGEIFGTLCIHNDQETEYSQEIYNMMHQFKKIVEAHFALAEQTKQLKESEEARRLSESRFRTLIEGSPDAVFVSLDQCFAYINEAALDLLGAENREQLLGRPVLDLVHPSFRDQIQKRHWSITEDEEPLDVSGEITCLRLDGSEVEVECSARPINYSGQNALLVFARDVTERRQLEQLKEDVDRITRHDLKTPLNGILGLPQVLLLEENLNEEQKELIGYIQQAGYRMLNMINMSLSLYQMENGEYDFHPQPTDIMPVIRDIQRDLSSLCSTYKNNISVSLVSAKQDDAFVVSGDKLLCYTMLSNLTKNAVERTHAGESVHIQLEEPETNQAKISIRNPGVIPEQVLDRLGQKYVTAGKQQGTGLGLYSVGLIVRTMNGSLTWSSSQESGTCFTVYLPMPKQSMRRWAYGSN
ncbi:MAG: PAS domain S-box protein [Desulfovermiculus sp.]